MSTTNAPKPDPRLPLVTFQFDGEPTKDEPKHCQLCWTKFSFIKSRHHCDNCFNCICSNCSQGRGRRETPGSWLSEVVVKLCDYCMPNLMIQALTRAQLKKLPKSYLQDYVRAYNLSMSNDKASLIDAIVSAHPMPLVNELHYRKFKPAHRNTGQSWKKERKNRSMDMDSEDSRPSEESRPALSIALPSPPADNMSQSLPSSISIRSDTSQLSNETNRISNAFDSLPQEWADVIAPIENTVSSPSSPSSPPPSTPLAIPSINRPPMITPIENTVSPPPPSTPLAIPSINRPPMITPIENTVSPPPPSTPLAIPSTNRTSMITPIENTVSPPPPSTPLAIPSTNRTPSPSNFQRHQHSTLSRGSASGTIPSASASMSIPSAQSARSSTPSPSSSPMSPYLQSQYLPEYYQQTISGSSPQAPMQQYPPTGYATQSPSFEPPYETRRTLMIRNLPAIPPSSQQSVSPLTSPSSFGTPPLSSWPPPSSSPPLPSRPPQSMPPPSTSPALPPRPPPSLYQFNSNSGLSYTPFPTPMEPPPRRSYEGTPSIASLAKNRTSLLTLLEETLEDIIAVQGVEIPRGLLAKSDLVREVQAMVDAHRRDQDQDEDRDICKVCLDNEIQTVLVECGHMAVCVECGDKLMRNPRPECPICRAGIIKVLRTFRS